MKNIDLANKKEEKVTFCVCLREISENMFRINKRTGENKRTGWK